MERYSHGLCFNRAGYGRRDADFDASRGFERRRSKAKCFTPHFLKEFKPIGAIGEEGDNNYIPPRDGFGFQHPEPKIIEMTPEQNN